jgi:hypothetical protein
MAGLLLGLGFIVLLVVSSIWSGYVLSILWSWFMVTTFGLPELSIPQAIGLSLILGYFHRATTKEQDPAAALAVVLVSPLIFLMIGWVVKGFM